MHERRKLKPGSLNLGDGSIAVRRRESADSFVVIRVPPQILVPDDGQPFERLAAMVRILVLNEPDDLASRDLRHDVVDLGRKRSCRQDE